MGDPEGTSKAGLRPVGPTAVGLTNRQSDKPSAITGFPSVLARRATPARAGPTSPRRPDRKPTSTTSPSAFPAHVTGRPEHPAPTPTTVTRLPHRHIQVDAVAFKSGTDAPAA